MNKNDLGSNNKHSNVIIFCPKYEEQIWNMHPRISLNLPYQGTVTCPYCSSKYENNS